MEKLVEHFSILYSKPNMVCNSALDAVESLAVMYELDAEPTLQDLDAALAIMTYGKATGSDGIPPRPAETVQKKNFYPFFMIF